MICIIVHALRARMYGAPAPSSNFDFHLNLTLLFRLHTRHILASHPVLAPTVLLVIRFRTLYR